jgi:hypothetical protein
LAWRQLNYKLRGSKSWFKDKAGSPIWNHLQRFDRLSRIGHYGILFFEFDDVGKPSKKGGADVTWADPAPGFEDEDASDDGLTDRVTNNAFKFPPRDGGNAKKAKGSFKGKVKPIKGKAGAFPPEEEELEDPAAEDVSLQEGDNESGAKSEASSFKKLQKGFKSKVNLIGIRTFDETHASVSVWEGNQASPRYGMPVEYTLQFGEVEGISSGTSVNSVLRDVKVHWSRVLHVSDGLMSSEFVGTPACRPCTNDLMDLIKIFGASSEGYWRMAFPGLSFESHPQLGSKVRFDAQGTKEQLERYQNTLQRHLATTGGSVKLLSGTVQDPTPHVEVRIEAICIYLKCPVRIFKGSERGQLASTQDKDSWDERMAMRQADHITPRIIVPFIDTLIRVGVLPEPDGYSVEWPDITQLSMSAKVAVAVQMVTAMTQYISGGVDTLMDPTFFLTKLLEFTQDEAEQMLKAAEEYVAEKQADEAQQAEEQGAIQAAQMASAGIDGPMPGMPGQPTPGAPGMLPGGGQPPFGAKPPDPRKKPPGAPKGPVPPQLRNFVGNDNPHNLEELIAKVTDSYNDGF